MERVEQVERVEQFHLVCQGINDSMQSTSVLRNEQYSTCKDLLVQVSGQPVATLVDSGDQARQNGRLKTWA